MWRPKNWDSREIVDKILTSDDPLTGMTASQSLVEAGATAMLEAIWKLAEESPTKTFTFDKNHFHVYREE